MKSIVKAFAGPLVAAVLVAGSLTSASVSWAADKCAAAPFVRNAANAMLGAARSGSPAAFSSVASRYTDLRGIALFALGPHRSLVSKSDEAKYVSLTRSFVGRLMAKHSGKISGGNLTIAGCSGSASAPVVNAQLGNGKRLVFKLYKTKRGYMVRDVNISSVWLAQQLKSTFVGVINRNGGDIGALYSYLR